MQAQVEGVQDEPAARDPEIRLVMDVMVPAQRRDAVAALETQARESNREGACPAARLGVRRAVEAAVGEPRDDLVPAVVGLRAAEQRRQRQLVVHHQAVHRHLSLSDIACRLARSSGSTRWPSRST